MNLQESIRRILRESVPPQVRRRQEEFDRIFLHYRDSFIGHEFKSFKSFWNVVFEATMETLYHALFSKTIKDDDWEESAEYIENYLIKKYKDETKQMWEKKHHNRLNESKSSNRLNIINYLVEPFKEDECICDIDMWYDDEDDMYLVYLVFGTEELNDKFTSDGKFGYVRKKQKEVKETINSFLPIKNIRVGSYGKPNCERSPLNESKTKTNSSLHKLLNLLFNGFDDIYYDWANYMCGMGECCDPYAIGFTLPNKHYDDYIFKLVDGEMYDDDGDYPKEMSDELPEVCYQQPDIKDPRFDTIVFYGHYAEEIEDYMGSERNWKSDLLKIINNQFGCEAKRIIII